MQINTLSSGLAPAAASQLHFVSADGSRKSVELNNPGEPLDFQSMNNLSQEEALKRLAQQNESSPESIAKLEAVASADGGFDVLFYQEGGGQGREGHFLYRLSPDGSLISEISLGNHIMEHGLERWFDFYADGAQLVLLSRVFATQQGVQAKRKGWAQNVVSWIDLATGMPISRLIPLDRQYLEAAMNAGDAGMQYLDGLPGGEPALLTKLNGVPLTVSVGMVSRRPALRINEATDQLMAYTEAYDKKQAKLAKQASRQQRKADRETTKQRMSAAETEAAPQDMNAQMAAIMAQAQKEMDADPNMTPEMRAQMSAIMAQMGQSPGGQNTQSPGLPVAQPQPAPAVSTSGSASPPGKALPLDANLQGFLEFNNEDGRAMTLLIFNRQSGDELLKKDYPDGKLNEHVDFSRFNLPLQHIGVIYREVTGMILEDMTPVVEQ